MSADEDISRWLETLGFSLPEARQRARARLEEVGLTRPGKQRLSHEKLEKARALLAERLFRHCAMSKCAAEALASRREPCLVTDRRDCESCGGSDNGRAAKMFLAACRSHRVQRVVIVGGSPAVREELTAALGQGLELRLVDGTERRTSDRAKSDVDWADLVLVWGASELHHKVSGHYTQVPPAARRKVLHVVKRGVAALLDEGVRHLSGAH